MVGIMIISEIEQKTNIRFQKIDGFENYINAIDEGYHSEDVIFTRWLCKLNTLEFNRVNRSQYGRGTDFKQDIVKYISNKIYIPTGGNSYKKCINYLTAKDYMDETLTFIRDEQRRSKVMKSARGQPCCKKNNIKIGCSDGFGVCPTNNTERNIAL